VRLVLVLAFLEHFDPDGDAQPLGWVTLTAKRRCWAAYREAHLDRCAGQEKAGGSDEPGFSLDQIAEEAPGATEAIERAEWLIDARRRLAELKPDERRALGLLGAGFSYAEIGDITQFSYTKTNRCIAEGRAALRASA
jgi:DNA-directed RNA polymerase specialized sigma24 family protein